MLKSNISIESARTEKLKSKLSHTTLKVRNLEKLAGQESSKLQEFEQIYENLMQEFEEKNLALNDLRKQNQKMEKNLDDLDELQHKLKIEEEILETQQMENDVLTQHLKEFGEMQMLLSSQYGDPPDATGAADNGMEIEYEMHQKQKEASANKVEELDDELQFIQK